MIIDTKFFEEIEIYDDDIICFDVGILGFEDLKKYIVIDMEENSIFKCLQSIEEKDVAFIIISPWDVFPDYEIDVDDSELLLLGDKDMNNLIIYTLVTITQNRITTNLIGPVIINIVSQKGRQVVLHKSNYTTRYDIMERVKKG